MPQWQAIIFDLDDTLYPERQYVLSGFRAVAIWAEATLGIAQNEGFASFVELFESGVRGDTFNRWLTIYGQPLTWIEPCVEVYRTHEPQLEPFPGIIDLLCHLSKHRIGLISDGYLTVQQRKLRALGVADAFGSIVFSDQWGRDYWKPHSLPYRTALTELGVPVAQAVYVGDNPKKDFWGARAVGMQSIAVRYSQGDYCHMPAPTVEHEADYCVDSVAALATLLIG